MDERLIRRCDYMHRLLSTLHDAGWHPDADGRRGQVVAEVSGELQGMWLLLLTAQRDQPEGSMAVSVGRFLLVLREDADG